MGNGVKGVKGQVKAALKEIANQTMPTVKGEDDWRAEDDCRTLQRAGEVLSDRKRLGRARAAAKKQMAGLKFAMGSSRR